MNRVPYDHVPLTHCDQKQNGNLYFLLDPYRKEIDAVSERGNHTLFLLIIHLLMYSGINLIPQP